MARILMHYFNPFVLSVSGWPAYGPAMIGPVRAFPGPDGSKQFNKQFQYRGTRATGKLRGGGRIGTKIWLLGLGKLHLKEHAKQLKMFVFKVHLF